MGQVRAPPPHWRRLFRHPDAGQHGWRGLARWSRRERPDVKVLLTSGRALPPGGEEWPMLAKPYRMGDVERELRELVGGGD